MTAKEEMQNMVKEFYGQHTNYGYMLDAHATWVGCSGALADYIREYFVTHYPEVAEVIAERDLCLDTYSIIALLDVTELNILAEELLEEE